MESKGQSIPMQGGPTVVEAPPVTNNDVDLIRQNFPVTRWKIVCILMIFFGIVTFILQCVLFHVARFQFGQGIWTSIFVILSAAFGLKAAISRGSTLWVIMTFVWSALTMVPCLTCMGFAAMDMQYGFYTKYTNKWSRDADPYGVAAQLAATQSLLILIMGILTLFLAIDSGIITVKKCRNMTCNVVHSLNSFTLWCQKWVGGFYNKQTTGVVYGPTSPGGGVRPQESAPFL